MRVLFKSILGLFKSKPAVIVEPSYVGHTLTILRKIKSKNGYVNSDIYLDGEKVAESLNDTFGVGERKILDYDILYEATDFPLLPDVILNHSNYNDLRISLIRKQIKSVTIEVIERYILTC